MRIINWFEKHYQFSFVISVLIAIVIFYISSIPFENLLSSMRGNWRSIFYHITIFFLFSFFLFISFVRGKNKKLFPLVIILSFIYAVLDELHQFFIPGRVCALSDVVLDTIGIMLAFVLYYFLIRFRKNG